MCNIIDQLNPLHLNELQQLTIVNEQLLTAMMQDAAGVIILRDDKHFNSIMIRELEGFKKTLEARINGNQIPEKSCKKNAAFCN